MDSIWSGSLAAFRERVAGSDPVPAGVSAAAVTATFALGLLTKVLGICARRKDFAGDPKRVTAMIESAQHESAVLQRAADQDIAAFEHYMQSRALGQPDLRAAIEIPMNAVHAAMVGLNLCEEAAGLVHAFVAADLGAAATLLASAIQAMLLSLDFNFHQLGSGELPNATRQLEKLALEQAETVRHRVLEIIG